MRFAFAILSLLLFTATLAAACERGHSRYAFEIMLHHDDGSDGAEILGIGVGNEILITSQLHVGLLTHQGREQTVSDVENFKSRLRAGLVSKRTVAYSRYAFVWRIPSVLVLGLFSVYPSIRLRSWWLHRHDRGRGFPIGPKV